MTRPMTKDERRAYNQRRHFEQRCEKAAARGDLGVADVWWDEVRRLAKDRAAHGDQTVVAELLLTLQNLHSRYGSRYGA